MSRVGFEMLVASVTSNSKAKICFWARTGVRTRKTKIKFRERVGMRLRGEFQLRVSGKLILEVWCVLPSVVPGWNEVDHTLRIINSELREKKGV
jgi:hypothetical protein